MAKQILVFLLLLAVAHSAFAREARNLSVTQGGGTQGNRWALVIGNDSYSHVTPLKNARADARAIAKALKASGFTVTLKLDANEKALKEAVRTFKGQLGGGDVALFYFSGHGVQLGAANYLLPVDINGENQEQIKDEALSLQRVLDDLQEQKTKFSLAIIDACRDNPFKGQGRAIGGRGLAPTTAATGQMVIYSAGTGQEALDRLSERDTSPNGLFTRIFLKEMQQPGVPVDRVLRNVREEVVKQAKNVGHEQVPALYDQVIREFYFKPPLVQPIVVSEPQPVGNVSDEETASEVAYWNSVKDSGRADLLAYLDKYPNGQFATLAKNRVIRIQQDLVTLISVQPKLYADQTLPLTSSDIPILYGPTAKILKGKATDAQINELLAVYRRDAEADDPVAQFSLGSMYRVGLGVQQDDIETYKWQRKAAEAGFSAAQSNLGSSYEHGQGVGKDEAEAVKWFRKAADQGFAIAQLNLGIVYAHGQGVAKDDAEAVRWYRKASAQGLADAQYNLGVVYANGQGVAKDEAEAVKWYRKAAEQGLATAQAYLGYMYEYGHGVAKDEAEAVRWYRKAVEQGDDDAMNNLGVMYQNGTGVAQDKSEAVKWYRKAAEKGSATAKDNLKRLGAE